MGRRMVVRGTISRPQRWSKIRFGGDRGAVLILIAVAILAVVGVIGLVTNISYQNVRVAELRAAGDAAVHAGAAALCPSEECWLDAQRAAIEVLKQYRLTTSLGNSQVLDLDATSGGPQWLVGTIRVTLERGRWVPNEGFQSLEGEAFARNHPQVPKILVANAFHIRVEVPDIKLFLNPFGDSSYTVLHESTATARVVRPQCVAPFAVPVCTLIDNATGNFHELSKLCMTERLFAGTARHCPPTRPQCQVLPGFQYRPEDDFGGYSIAHSECRWTHRDFSDAGDHYGVVGLPGRVTVTESRIVSLLQSSDCTDLQAGIGDTFTILEDGLTQPDSDTRVWNAIVDAGRRESRPFGGTQLQTMLPNATLAYGLAEKVQAEQASLAKTLCVKDRLGTIPNPRDYPIDGLTDYGHCNSHRMAYKSDEKRFPYGSPTTVDVYSPSYCHPAEALPVHPPNPPLVDTATPVLEMKVPVIADYSSSAGKCSSDGGFDPVPDPNGSWKIVGFTKVLIYDVDIGNPPPPAPDHCGTGFATGVLPPMILLENTRKPWTFVGPAIGTPHDGNCNLVRARIKCGTNFISAAKNEGRVETTLVETSL